MPRKKKEDDVLQHPRTTDRHARKIDPTQNGRPEDRARNVKHALTERLHHIGIPSPRFTVRGGVEHLDLGAVSMRCVIDEIQNKHGRWTNQLRVAIGDPPQKDRWESEPTIDPHYYVIREPATMAVDVDKVADRIWRKWHEVTTAQAEEQERRQIKRLSEDLVDALFGDLDSSTGIGVRSVASPDDPQRVAIVLNLSIVFSDPLRARELVDSYLEWFEGAEASGLIKGAK